MGIKPRNGVSCGEESARNGLSVIVKDLKDTMKIFFSRLWYKCMTYIGVGIQGTSKPKVAEILVVHAGLQFAFDRGLRIGQGECNGCNVVHPLHQCCGWWFW
ncbi:hypothetical protein PanWU01x14_088840 [Parasponia andersonii]|uniref:Uncharacterized protein n=1 Tax=Parasponia andersonii TaxID=3476 RepID=A0A2P5D802_PARAD|nr:hypothetical protein PanWU01x14_088840 [Parasponia andersonii]